MSSAQIANFCGALNQNIRQLETKLDLSLALKGDKLAINSKQGIPGESITTIERLLNMSKDDALSASQIDEVLHHSGQGDLEKFERYVVKLKKKYIKPKTELQCDYLQSIAKKIINFGIGPAGTGKTYLAVAMAVQALENEDVSRLILTRPAVEAGEKLGFLPGLKFSGCN